MGKEVTSIAEVKLQRRLSFRERVSRMSKNDLMGEFLLLMSNSVGKEWSVPEAEDCQFFMEKLLAVSENEVFKYQLSESLRILKSEIAQLRN